MIKPTIGRVVWFFPGGHKPGEQPHAALIAFVHGDKMINLGAVDQNGNAYSACSVPLLQDDDQPHVSGYYAQWMPYQIGQAAKHENTEKVLLDAETRNM